MYQKCVKRDWTYNRVNGGGAHYQRNAASEQLCVEAANTMLSICNQCQQHMVNHLETLIGIVVSTEQATHMPSEASIELLKGAVVIACNLPTSEMIGQPLARLCNIQLEGLNAALNDTKQLAANGAASASSSSSSSSASTSASHTATKTSQDKQWPLYWLDRFTAIFRTIKIKNATAAAAAANGSDEQQQQHPCKHIVESVWPTFSACFAKHPHDAKITESCCRALRFALRSTDKHSRHILGDVVNVIVSMYRTNHYSCFLYLGSILVDIYGHDETLKSGLVEMMQAFTSEAFDFIVKKCGTVDNVDELRKHPDTLDDFFRLALRFLQRCPLEFVVSPIFSPIMTLAVSSLNVDNRDANLSITKFLSEFISLSHKTQIQVRAVHSTQLSLNKSFKSYNNNNEKGLNETNQSLVNSVLNEIGHKMIENTINSTINMTTRDTKDGIADVICELLGCNRKVRYVLLHYYNY